jgi:hypothetical protein
MAMSTDKNYIGVIIGYKNDGKLVVTRYRRNCGSDLDYTNGNIIGSKEDGLLVAAYYSGACDTPEIFNTADNYMGFIIGEKEDGLPVVASMCIECDDPEDPTIPICDCTYPTTLNYNLVQYYDYGDLGIVDEEFDGTLTWGSYVTYHCFCGVCHEDPYPNPGESCYDRCPDWADDSNFESFCFVDNQWCYACYSDTVTGYVSQPIPVINAVYDPQTNGLVLQVCRCTLVLTPGCAGSSVTWGLRWYPEECGEGCQGGKYYYDCDCWNSYCCGTSPDCSTACPEPPGSSGDPGEAIVNFVYDALHPCGSPICTPNSALRYPGVVTVWQ